MSLWVTLFNREGLLRIGVPLTGTTQRLGLYKDDIIYPRMNTRNGQPI